MEARGLPVAALVACIAACSSSPPSPPPRLQPTALAFSTPLSRPPLQGSAVMFHDEERVDHEPTYAFSPDGRWIAVEHVPHVIAVYGARTGEPKARFDAPGDVLEMGFRPDGEALWAVTHLGAAIWDLGVASPTVAVFARGNPKVRRAAWNRTGDLLAVIDSSGDLRVVDAVSGLVRVSAQVGLAARIDKWAFASDIVITKLGSKRSLWDVSTGNRLADIEEPKGWSAELGPDARTAVLTAETGDRFRIVDALTGAKRAEHVMKGKAAYQSPMSMEAARPQDGGPAQVLQVLFSHDGQRLAIGHDPPNSVYGMYVRHMDVAIYDTATGKRISETKESLNNSGLDTFSQDGTKLYGYDVGGDNDDGARVFDVKTGARLRGIPASALPPSGLTAAVRRPSAPGADPNDRLEISDAATRAPLWSVPVERAPSSAPSQDEPFHAALSRGDLRLAFSGPPLEHAVVVLSPSVGLFQGDERTDYRTIQLVFSPAGLVRVEQRPSYFDRISLLDADNGDLSRRFETKLESRAYAVSRDGARLAMAFLGGIHLLGTTTGKPIFDIPTDLGTTALAFSPDGQILAAGSHSAIRTFDVEKKAQLAELASSSDDMLFLQGGSLRFVDKDKKLVTADPTTGAVASTVDMSGFGRTAWSESPCVKLDDDILDTRSGKKVPMAQTLAGPVIDLSPDGQHIAAVTFDSTLTLMSTEDGRIERDIVVPAESELLGFADDSQHIGIGTPWGAWLVRLADGAFFRVDFVTGGPPARAITSLDSGHFDGSAEAIAHVRLFVPGSRGAAKVLGPGAERDAFHRADPRLDFFKEP